MPRGVEVRVLLGRTKLAGSIGKVIWLPPSGGPFLLWSEEAGLADELTESALRYHRLPRPGKIEVVPTKPLATQRDLSLAYSPGVAAACDEIVRDPGDGGRADGARQPGRRW